MEYNINKKTLALIPTGVGRCKVIEERKTYNLRKTSFQVIENSCKYFGVSFESRLEGSQEFTRTKYKSPIVIEETSRLVFIPIRSAKKNTLWISYNNIADYYPSMLDKGCTNIIFKNGNKLVVPISYYSFNNQFLKAARLSAVLADRTTRNYQKS